MAIYENTMPPHVFQKVGPHMFQQVGPFWMVWREGHAGPTQKHANKADAIAEAQRLADKHRNEKFVVLQAVSEVRAVVTNVQIICTELA